MPSRELQNLATYAEQYERGDLDGQEVVTDSLTELIKFARTHVVDLEHALELARDHAATELRQAEDAWEERTERSNR